MTTREAIHRIWQKFENGTPSDDARLRQRRVYSALMSARAFVLEKSKLSDFNYTTLSCVPLEKTTAHECGCIPLNDCSYYKTVCEIPATLSNSAIKDVTTIDGRIMFGLTDWGSIKYLQADKYTGTAPRYFIKNGHAFFINVPFNDLKIVTMRGVFSDPVKALQNCSLCSPTDCFSLLDSQFPIDARFENQVIEIATQELQKIAEQDRVNDNA
jgi:hypothetical protein